jgi:hypothetical protein
MQRRESIFLKLKEPYRRKRSMDRDRKIVLSLVGRLPESHGSSVRRAAQAVLDSIPVCAPDMAALVQSVTQPTAHRWREYVVACWALSQLDPPKHLRRQAAQGLAVILDGSLPKDWFEAASEDISTYPAIPSVLFGLGAAIAMLPGYWEDFQEDGGIVVPAILVVSTVIAAIVAWLLSLALAIPLIAPVLADNRQRKAKHALRWAIQSLARWREVQGLGPIARRCIGAHSRLRSQARAALPELLAAVKEADYGRFPASEQQSIVSLVEADIGKDVKVAVIRALGLVGGAPVLEAINSLVSGPLHPELAQAAGEVLPAIERRAEMERNSDRLLRPSASAERDRMLVRPAVITPDSDPDRLVRPAIRTSSQP